MILAFSLLSLLACESGTARRLEIVLTEARTSVHRADSPGLVVTDLAERPLAIAALCGQAEPTPLSVTVDDGFGCLRERAGAGGEQTIRVWIDPAPSAFEAPALCAAPRDPQGILALPTPEEAGLAASPDAGWAQAQAVGVWSRDFSPCGGVLEGGTVTL